ncbi:unnamed protein product [Cylicostephanus goldi]|uniref:tRNA-intron lyase n=1 Tax=Cylicostephanus goldi TaxID=71465 RepID=A0A3P6TPX5_CYLGO|nr:unnamed protein product [Cylicostephanus goldi]
MLYIDIYVAVVGAYGASVVIYRGSPGSHHAAAGVKIETQIEPRFFIGLNRALTNMKKALVIVTPIIPDGLNTSTQRCVDSVHISVGGFSSKK